MERITKQRAAIYHVLEQATRPLSIEEILHAARTEYPALGVRTVFRHLKALTQEYKLVRLSFPGQPHRFELPAGKHHPHVICRECQKVFNLERETPNILDHYPSPPEFELNGEEVVFYGHCKIKNCANRKTQ